MIYEDYLENGIKYIIIENMSLDNTYFCYTYKKGSMSDNIKYQGQSHFQEHLCFYENKTNLSSVNNLRKFVRNSNGYLNAFTNLTYWNIVSKIKPEKFEDFIYKVYEIIKNPGFNIEIAKNEIYSIQEEHMFRNRNDSLNISYMIKNLNNKNSSYKKYLLGNFETLKILDSNNEIDLGLLDDLVKNIKEDYNKNLSSNLMNIVIHTNISYIKIKELLNNTFNNFTNKNLKINYNFKNYPAFDKFKKLVKYKPSLHLNYVSLIFYVNNKIKFNRISYLFLRFLFFEKNWFFNNLEKNISSKLEIYFDSINEEFLIIEFRIILTNYGVKVYYKPIKLILWFISYIIQKSSDLSEIFEEFKKIHWNEFINYYYNLNKEIDLVKDISKFINILKEYNLNFTEYHDFIEKIKYDDIKKEFLYLLENMSYEFSNIFLISKYIILDKKNIKRNKLLKYQYSIEDYDKNLINILTSKPEYKEEIKEFLKTNFDNSKFNIEIYESNIKKKSLSSTFTNLKKPYLKNNKEVYFNWPIIHQSIKNINIENIKILVDNVKYNLKSDHINNFFQHIIFDNNLFNTITFQIIILKNQDISRKNSLFIIKIIENEFSKKLNNQLNYDGSSYKFEFLFGGISVSFYSWKNEILNEYLISLNLVLNYILNLNKEEINELIELYSNFKFNLSNNSFIDYKSRNYMIDIISNLLKYNSEYENFNYDLNYNFYKLINLKNSICKIIIGNNINNDLTEIIKSIYYLFKFNDCKEIENNYYTINLQTNTNYTHVINKNSNSDYINSIGIYFQIENNQLYKFYELEDIDQDLKHNFYLIFILKQSISHNFWNHVRFYSKIGYYIYNEITLNNGVFGIIYYIESYKYNSMELEKVILDYLDSYINNNDNDFFINNILESLNEQNNIDFIFTKDFNKNIKIIFENFYLYDFKNIWIKFIEQINIKELLSNFYLKKRKVLKVYENSYYNKNTFGRNPIKLNYNSIYINEQKNEILANII